MKATKKFTIFAGVNGAGKSTLFYSEANHDLGIRLNSDEILHSLGLDWKDMSAQILAGKKLLQLQKECLSNGVSFNQETTLSGQSIFNVIKKAKELGYAIHLRYVGVANPEIAKERVAKRIARGGHGVSDGTLERRFTASKENFIKIYPLCDSIIMYDNTAQMTCVASINAGKITLIQHIDWVDELLKELNLIQ